MRRAAVAIAVLVALGAAFWWWHNSSSNDPYAAALKQYGIRDQVFIDNTQYESDSGVVTSNGQAASESAMLEANKLAFAVALAERNPLIGLEGVDPDALSKAVDALQSTADVLASHQSNAQDAAAVKNNIYPLAFLRAASVLEAARLAFIAHASSDTEVAYDAAMQRAIDAYQSDLAAFTAEFDRVVPDDLLYAVPVGAISKTSQDITLDALASGIKATQVSFARRESCLSGKAADCEASDLALPTVPASDPVALSTQQVSQGQQLRSLLRQVYTKQSFAYADGPLLALPKSSCLDNIATPLFVISGTAGTGNAESKYVGDIGLVSTKRDSAYYSNYAKFGISYAFYELENFYSCPELLADQSRMALMHEVAPIAGFATSTVVQESDVLEYVRTATSSVLLTLKASERSEMLPDFMMRMAAEEKRNENLIDRGYPLSRSVDFLFSVRSAFFSLFLSDNPSVAGSHASIASSVPVPRTSLPYIYYTDIQTSLPLPQLKADLANYFAHSVSTE